MKKGPIPAAILTGVTLLGVLPVLVLQGARNRPAEPTTTFTTRPLPPVGQPPAPSLPPVTTTTLAPVAPPVRNVPISSPQPANSQPSTPVTPTTFANAPNSLPGQVSPAWNCAEGLPYLIANTAPGYSFVCGATQSDVPTGAVSMTCISSVPWCADGSKVIIMTYPACKIAYQDEAANSWTIEGLPVPWMGDGTAIQPVDPFGEC